MFSAFLFSQTIDAQTDFFVNANIGCQISGCKSEDYVWGNVAPLIGLSVGKYFTKELALRLGYNGTYFKTIENFEKQNFCYLHGDVIFNVHNAIDYKVDRIWNLAVYCGAGYLHNYYSSKSLIAANFGVINSFRINKYFSVNIDLASICGWQIYQKDQDILPSLSAGIVYRIYKK